MAPLNIPIAFNGGKISEPTPIKATPMVKYSTDQTFVLNNILQSLNALNSTVGLLSDQIRKYILRTNPDPDVIGAKPINPYWKYEDAFTLSGSTNSGVIALETTIGKPAAPRNGYLILLSFFSDSADELNPGTWTFYINGSPISPLTARASSLLSSKSDLIGKLPVVIPFKVGDRITYLATNTSTASVYFSMIAEGWYI